MAGDGDGPGENRTGEAMKQLFCGGLAGSIAKTLTAPFSRLTILFQVHSLVTRKKDRPIYAMSLRGGFSKVIERGGYQSLWKGNMTSVLHRFPYSALNFFVYENTLDFLTGMRDRHEEESEKASHLARRMTHSVMKTNQQAGRLARRVTHRILQEDPDDKEKKFILRPKPVKNSADDTLARHKAMAGAAAGCVAVIGCYPLDLVRTRLTTEFEGHEHYRGMTDAFKRIATEEGFMGFYSGLGPTLLVAVPNFAISYSVYGTLKEHALDDDLFYNLRRIDADSGEKKLGMMLTVLCGAASGCLSTCLTFPMDTIRRRMQIQNLHVAVEDRLTSRQQFTNLVTKEGLRSVYRGLTPELLKVIPMVGTMFMVYEWSKDVLDVKHNR
jgi:hypothetical protein